jgi:hypothetical protein
MIRVFSSEKVPPHGRIEVTCDGCDFAPTADQILSGHGLINMGWAVQPPQHFCPKCKEQTNGND